MFLIRGIEIFDEQERLPPIKKSDGKYLPSISLSKKSC